MKASVGLENLPNVYISKITLEDHSTNGFLLNVELEIQDAQKDSGFYWSDDKVLLSFLKVNLVATRNPRVSNLLKDGTIVPIPSDISRLNNPDTNMNTFGLSEFKHMDSGSSKIFRKKFTYNIENGVQDLHLYAVCFFDTMQASSDLNIRLENIYSRYNGAVCSEIVFVQGEIKSSTTLFLRPDNTVWAGPVHEHEGTYMEGSFHSSEPHNKLRRITVQNYKITDNRKKNYGSRQGINRKFTPIIGDLMFSFNNNTDLSGMFVFNIKQMALTRTKYGRQLYNLSNRLFVDYLSTIKIRSLTIKRQQVKSAVYRNTAGSPKFGSSRLLNTVVVADSRDIKSYQLQEDEKIKEIFLFPDKSLRAFQFIDDEKSSKSKGEYQYKVEIRILDQSHVFLQNKINDLKLLFNDLKDLRSIIGRNSNYDFKLSKIKDSSLLDSKIVSIVNGYYNHLQYFENFTNSEKEFLIKEKLKNFTFNNYNLLVHDRFITEFQKLMTLFSKRYKTSDKENYAGAVTDRKSFVPGSIELSRVFSDIISFRDMFRSYDYLGIKNNIGFPIITTAEMNDRATKEVQRFFSGNFVNGNDDFSQMDVDTKQAFGDINASRMSFFSPLSLMVNSEEINLDNLMNIDHDKLTTRFMEGKDIFISYVQPKHNYGKKQTKGFNQSKKRTRQTFSKNYSFSRDSGPQSAADPNKNDDALSLLKSENFLGLNSEFVNAEEGYKESVIEESDRQTNAQFDSYYNFTRDTFKSNFDLQSAENSFSNYLGSKHASKENTKGAPNQYKALVGSRSSNTKNDILESDTDPLRSVNTKVASEIIYKSFQKVEIFVGYEKDINGIDILTSPIFVKADNVDLDDSVSYFCRMSYHSEEMFGIKVNPDFKLPVINRFFFISSTDLNNLQDQALDASNLTFNISAGNEISKNIKFATSNIVTQNKTKNPLAASGFTTRSAPRPRNAVADQTTPNRGTVYSGNSRSTTSGGGTSGGGTPGGRGY